MNQIITFFDRDFCLDTVTNNDIGAFNRKLEEYRIRIETDSNAVTGLKMYLQKALIDICIQNRSNFVSHLINNSYEEYVDFKFLFTHAVDKNSFEIVKMLVQLEKAPALTDQTIIEKASNSELNVLRYLIDCGYVITPYALYNVVRIETPFFDPEQKKKIKLILNCGTDINYVYRVRVWSDNQSDFYTVLNRAITDGCSYKRTDIIVYLLQNGAEVNSTHLESSISNTDIFHLIHSQRSWDVMELENVLMLSVFNPRVLDYLLHYYVFPEEVLDLVLEDCTEEKNKEIQNIYKIASITVLNKYLDLD